MDIDTVDGAVVQALGRGLRRASSSVWGGDAWKIMSLDFNPFATESHEHGVVWVRVMVLEGLWGQTGARALA